MMSILRALFAACTVLACLVLVCVEAPAGDELTTYEDVSVKGDILRLTDGFLEVRPEGEEEIRKVSLGDATQIILVPQAPDLAKNGSALVVDNDGDHPPTAKSGKIKLREGLHNFTVLYFQGVQGASLDFSWEGPQLKKQTVPPDAIVKWKTNQNEVTWSPGLDDEGFRLPDQLDEPLPQVGYKLYEWPTAGTVKQVGDLRNLTLKKYGTTRQVALNFQHSSTNFGAMFYGLLKVPRDGEYTFYLNSDDGSQLYIGKAPPISQPSVRQPGDQDWLFRFAGDSEVHGPLTGWDDAGVHCEQKFGGTAIDFAIPPAELRGLWSREYADKRESVDRSGEQNDVDTVYAKNAEGQVQQVAGQVLGIADNSLKFEYNGAERSIGLERVVAVIPRKPQSASSVDQRRVRMRFDLCGPTEFVGHLVELTPGRAEIELPWGQSISLSRNWIYRMTVLNGRMQLLEQLEPAEVVETPFLDRILQWQAGKSLTGGELKIGQQSYSKGISLHSRTRLTWDLDGQFERFQGDLGLQHPEGEAGNALVRILVDGESVHVTEEVKAESAPISLDLDVSDKSQLTIDVDFGKNMHIGDHVVIGNARLLRPERTP